MAGFQVSDLIDHGFVHSIYAHDPNGIPIEFSYNVETVDIRIELQMRDESPSKITLEGADPKPDFWPEVIKKTPKSERIVYPGAGSLKLADLAPRIQRLRQHQEQLNATRLELESLLSDRKVELADAKAVKNCIEDLRTMLEESTITERKSFIKSIIREVTVASSEVTLSYRPPLLAGMMSTETLSVPSIVQGGGLKCTIDRTFTLTFNLDR